MTTQNISIPQHDAAINDLTAELTNQNTFAEVNSWDEKAKAALAKITTDFELIEREVAATREEFQRLQAQDAQFFRRAEGSGQRATLAKERTPDAEERNYCRNASYPCRGTTEERASHQLWFQVTQ